MCVAMEGGKKHHRGHLEKSANPDAVPLVNDRADDGVSPVMYSRHRPQNAGAPDALIAYGADLKALDKDGREVSRRLSRNAELPPGGMKRGADKISALTRK